MGLSEGQLRIMRNTVVRMTHKCVGSVYRPFLEDVDGDTKKTYLPVSGLQNIACDVMMPKGQRTGGEGERLQPAHDRVIEFAFGTDVRADDLVRADGEVWEIVGTDAVRSDALSLRCQAVSDLEGRL